MNEKFWDLGKEKQDRMLNAAMKIFGIHGYKRASTDEMVKEAGISKGLLFHYFISKEGLYEYVFEYSTRYMRMELSGVVNEQTPGYFDRCRQIEQCKYQVMKNYPYMQLFLDRALEEPEEAVGAKMKERHAQYEEFCHKLYENTEFGAETVAQKCTQLMQIVELVKQGTMRQCISAEESFADAYFTEVSDYLNLLRELTEY